MIEDLHYTAMCAEVYNNPEPKLIKVTSNFAAYLGSVYKDEIEYKTTDMPNGVSGYWTGIPIVTDDKIQHPYYELVF